MTSASLRPHGRVHANGIDFAYLEAGPPDGPLALCLHGFADHAPSFEGLLQALGAAGFHAVAPWMRGYHPTGFAPDGRYQSALLALDAVALIEALSPDGTASLVGHDWGAVAACGAAAIAPQRVRRLVSMAVPHQAVFAQQLVGDWEQRKRSWYMWFFQLPVVPEMMVAADAYDFVDRLWADWSPGYTPAAGAMEALKATLAEPGVLEASLAYYRDSIDFRRQADELAGVQGDVSGGRVGAPALFLFGADDGCIAPDAAGESLAFCDGPASVEVLDECGHFLHLERPGEVAELVLRALSG